MAIAFDPRKDAINKRKHGVSLDRAQDFDLVTAHTVVDDSEQYNEIRYRSIGFLDAKLCVFVSHCDRNGHSCHQPPRSGEERAVRVCRKLLNATLIIRCGRKKILLAQFRSADCQRLSRPKSRAMESDASRRPPKRSPFLFDCRPR